MIIGRFVSLFAQRLGATLGALWLLTIAALNAGADANPDSTWFAINPLPHQANVAILALAVDPVNSQNLLSANSEGSLLRSTNGGVSWTPVHSGKTPLTTITFNPYASGLVLVGTRGAGALASKDGGATWASVTGLDRRTVRVFGFALALYAAGTDHGVFVSTDGFNWTPSGLSDRSISALAVEAIHPPVKMVAGSDSQGSAGILSLFQSNDGGTSWTQFNPAISGTIAVRLVAGPLPPTGNVRPLVAGTNAGLFESTDNGGTFTALSGGGLLPTTDYTQANFITDHYDHFYVASDGGGSGSGGLWRTNDAGRSFTSMAPPEQSVTALAVSNDENPTLYVATFRPRDHVASLWVFHDTGATPQGPASPPSSNASGARTSGSGRRSGLFDLAGSPQLPYIALGVAALAVILTAVVAHFRARNR